MRAVRLDDDLAVSRRERNKVCINGSLVFVGRLRKQTVRNRGRSSTHRLSDH